MKLLTTKTALLAFLAVVAVFFSPTILRGRMPVPTDALVGLYHPWRDLYAATNPRGVTFKNFLITDPVRQQIPWRKIAIDQWKSGQIPGFNPYAFSGTSLIGNIQAAIWYPLNILFFILPFPLAWTVLIILEPILCGLFLYAYLTNRKFSPAASLVGAVTFAFSGFAVSWLTWGTMVHVAAWLPMALLALDKKKLWWLVGALAMMVVAGHLQIALYAVATVFLYALWSKRNDLFTKAALIAAFMTIPAWTPVVMESLRSGRVFADTWRLAEGWFIPVTHLAQFVAPDYFGNPATLNYWGTWNYGEMVGYIGIVPLIFAVFAIVRYRDRWNKFWMLLGGAALLGALATPIGAVPYMLGLPIISSLQPTRLLLIVVVSLVMLAVSGFEAWQKEGRSPVWKAVTVVGLLLLVLWAVALFVPRMLPDLATNFAIAKRNLILPTFLFAGTVALLGIRQMRPRAGGFVGIVLVGLVAFDLLRFAWKFTPFSPPEYFFPQTQVIEFLQKQPKPFRVMSMDDRILPPNTSAYFGIESIEGYDPLYSSRYEQFFRALALGTMDEATAQGSRILTMHNIDSPFLPLLNVKYVLALEDLSSELLRPVFREGEVRVYEYVAALPRVYFAQKISNERGMVEDPTITTVEAPIDVLSVPAEAAEAVTIETYTDNHMTVRAFAANPRLLVIASPYDAGWRVWVNGKRHAPLRVNFLFFGVVVPAGENVVEFSYAP
jgi:hypothetical protein